MPVWGILLPSTSIVTVHLPVTPPLVAGRKQPVELSPGVEGRLGMEVTNAKCFERDELLVMVYITFVLPTGDTVTFFGLGNEKVHTGSFA